MAMGYDHGIFSPGKHRNLASAMIVIRERGEPVNHVTLIDEMTAARSLDSIGGELGIAEVMTLADTSAHSKTFLRIVLDGYRMRRFRDCVEELNRMARNARFMDARSSIENSMTKISELCNTENGEKPEDMFAEAKAMLMALAGGKEVRRSRPVYSGIDVVDKEFGPLDVATSDHNVLLMGPTSFGKSSLSSQYISTSVSNGLRTVAFLGETAKVKLPLQVVGQREKVSTGYRFFGKEPMDRQRRAIRALDEFKGEAEGLLFAYDSNFTIESVIGRCRSISSKVGPIDLVVIDHVHLLKTSRRASGTTERMEYLSSCLKPLAKELDCVVLSLAQPGREMQKENRPPRLADLKGSGSLENDADRVLALYPPASDSNGNDQDRSTLRPEVHLLQLKMRDGPTGEVKLRFDKEFTLFRELD